MVVDAAGDAFVADSSLEEVVEVPAGCTNINCQFAVASGIMSHGATVDAAGNIFIANLEANQVVKLNRSQPPSLNFPTSTNAGSRDTTDGASLVTLQNVGNTTLSFPIPSSGNNPSIGPDFSLFSNGQGDCPLTTSSSSLPGTLSAGDLCVYSVTFAPMTAGSLSESLVLTDNNLNAISPSAAASQSIALSGVGVATNFTLAVSTAGSGSGTLSGTNCSTGSYPPGTIVTCAAAPAAGSQFTGWSGACSGSGSCSFTLSSNSTVIANFSTAYTLTVTEVGTGSGSVTDGSQITCSIANGSVTGTCAGSYSSGTSVMLTANATGASIFEGWGGACASAGASATCTVLVNQAANAIATFNPQNFGNVNVCPAGQSSPAPCSQTLTLTYTMAASTNLGATQVVTQGTTELDFARAAAHLHRDHCGRQFLHSQRDLRSARTRLAPGCGALFDNSGNILRIAGLWCWRGAGCLSPARNHHQHRLFALSSPKGVLVDAAGNLFISDTATQQVIEIPPHGAISTVGFGFLFPQGMAEDGAGDLFVADNNLNQVVEIPAGCTSSGCQKYVASKPGQSEQVSWAWRWMEPAMFSLATSGTAWSLRLLPMAAHRPSCITRLRGVALLRAVRSRLDLTADAAGDLFIADYGLQTVVEVPAGCTAAVAGRRLAVDGVNRMAWRWMRRAMFLSRMQGWTRSWRFPPDAPRVPARSFWSAASIRLPCG